MANSRHLNLSFISPSQAQKNVRHNEAIKRLDEIIHISVLSRGVNIAPVSSADGARYIIGDVFRSLLGGICAAHCLF